MRMNAKERKDLALSKVVLVALAVVGLMVVVWLGWLRADSKLPVSSFETCKAAGFTVQESHPLVCVTDDGRRFTAPRQAGDSLLTAQLTVVQWGISVPLADSIADAYYTYHAEEDQITYSTPALDQAKVRIQGCTSGLYPLVYDRAKPGDARKEIDGSWTEAGLQLLGKKVGEYYYFESPETIETLCLPDQNDPNVKKVQDIQDALRTSFTAVRR